MKRFLLLSIAIAVLVSAAASAELKPGIRPLVKVAMVATSYNSNDVQDVDAGFGFSVGGGVRIPLGEGRFVLEPEALYTSRRAWVRVQEGNNPGSLIEQFEIQYQHIDVPILMNWNFSRGPEMDLYLQGGIVPSFLLDAKAEDTSGDKTEIDTANSTFWSVALAIGTRAGPVIAEIGYRWGLTNVAVAENADDPRLDSFNFSFGVVF